MLFRFNKHIIVGIVMGFYFQKLKKIRVYTIIEKKNLKLFLQYSIFSASRYYHMWNNFSLGIFIQDYFLELLVDKYVYKTCMCGDTCVFTFYDETVCIKCSSYVNYHIQLHR